MDAGIDFLAQNLLSTFDGKNSHLLTQNFARLNGWLFGFRTSGSNDFARFFAGPNFGFFDDGLGAAVRVGKTCRRLVARLRQLLLDTLVGSAQLGFGTVGSSEAIGDFLGSFIQCLRDRGPHEFHREQDQDQKDNGLNEQGRIDTHGNTFLSGR